MSSASAGTSAVLWTAGAAAAPGAGAAGRAFEPPAHRLKPAERVENLRCRCAGRQCEARGYQRIGGLIGADQRQVPLARVPRKFDLQRLAKLPRCARDQADAVSIGTLANAGVHMQPFAVLNAQWDVPPIGNVGAPPAPTPDAEDRVLLDT